MGRRKRQVKSQPGERAPARHCDCDPLFERLCDRIRQDRRQIVSHIQQTNTVLSDRLDNLERRTRHEVSGDRYQSHETHHQLTVQVRAFEENMKECLAEERSACQDRVDRQAFRERLEWSQRQELRDGVLKHEISDWLEASS